ncbi:prolactin-releasing peptide receptor [Periplaneta americana]|uniref:prolactin-releasing peptide receptor n=1 Tax=Periplaneta americana TaxID=6978 RepID=UPI0037E78057
MTNTRIEDLSGIPDKWLSVVAQFIIGMRNDSGTDFSKPHLRPSVVRVYPLFVFLYALIVLVGTVSNLAVICTIVKNRLYRDPTYGYIINLSIADIVKCVLVLPISLTILLVQNWIFGSFLCFFLPMLQDIPLHVSMLSFLLIAVDRYRLMLDPTKPRMPAFVCALGTWLLAVCIVLPYPIYITYLDLGNYIQKHFDGVGICAVNLVDDMQEYMRGLFIVMYVLPLTVISYLYVRVSRELKMQEGPLAVMMYEARTREGRSRADSSCQDFRGSQQDCGSSQYSFRGPSERSGNFDLYEAELDVRKEKRNQKYLISMVTIFAICLCPLMVLRVAKLALTETYDNSGHFDITFTLFVWIAFLPTCTTPCLFASWRMSRIAKERLRGYFRFSNRKLRRGCEAALEAQQQQQRPAHVHNMAYSEHDVGVGGANGLCIADVNLEAKHHYRQDLTSS